MRIALIAAAALLASGAIAQKPAPRPAPAAAVVASATLPPGPGQAQVKAACSTCHAITMVTGKRYTAAKWDEVVEQMVSRGAPVKDADYDIVVAYLAKNFGVKK